MSERVFVKNEYKPLPELHKMTSIETYTNDDMVQMLTVLDALLTTAKGKFGYAVARNVRKIREACTEYLQIRQNLFEELGEEEKDEDGNPTGNIQIKIGSPEHNELKKRLGEFSNIEHAVEICKVSYSVLPDDITAGDMLNLEWMLTGDMDEEEKSE